MITYAWLLIIGYSTSLVLVIIYFVWEDSIFHYSRRVESAYLSFVLFIIYLCSVKFGMDFHGFGRKLDTPVVHPDNVLRGLQTLRHLMLICVLLHIAQRFVLPQVLPSFYDTPGCTLNRRQEKLWRIAVRHPKAVRIAGEISDLVDSIVRVIAGLLPAFFTKSTVHIILAFIMLSELTSAIACFWWIDMYLGDTVEIVAVCAALVHFARRLLLLGARVESLNELLEEVVRERRKPYLTYILATVSVATLMEVSKSMLWLLTEQALHDDLLDTTSKAILIDALQKAGLRSTKRQMAIMRLITSTAGTDLIKLKNLIDGRGGYHNLYKLVYQDIVNRAVREKVLRHLQSQADAVQRSPSFRRGIKILSDMDDTLFCSGGHFPAGCDRRFPKGVVYPGCLTLFRVLDKTFDAQKPSCNIVFLSARPHVYGSWMEEKSYRLFRDLLAQERIHTFPTLLPGQLSTGLKAMLRHCAHRRHKTLAWRNVGELKYQTFLNYLRLYQEYDFVFCGDDGQGDLLAAQYMLQKESCLRYEAGARRGSREESPAARESSESEECLEDKSCRTTLGCRGVIGEEDSEYEVNAGSVSSSSSHSSGSGSGSVGRRRKKAGRLLAVLIHEVIREDECLPLALEPAEMRNQAWYEDLRRNNLIFHRSYVGAAVELHLSHPDIVTLEDVRTVAQDAIQEFEEAKLMYPEMSGSWKDTEAELVKDLERANEALQEVQGPQLRRPRGSMEFDDSDPENTSPYSQASSMHRRQITAEWLESGGLAGCGDLRERFLDLLPNTSDMRRKRSKRLTAHSRASNL